MTLQVRVGELRHRKIFYPRDILKIVAALPRYLLLSNSVSI